MSGFRNTPCLKRIGGSAPWQLHEDLLYDSELYGGLLVAPAGFCTDFASIPWMFRRILPKDGAYTYAAILHDYHCVKKPKDITSKMAAGIFREAMLSAGVSGIKAGAMYRAVRWFGPRWP